MSPSNFPSIGSTSDLRYGKDPLLDAWLLHFMTENSIEHSIDPALNASPEQIRFMVALGADQIYVPCSDAMLGHLLEKNLDPSLLDEYSAVWRRILELIGNYAQTEYDKVKIEALCDHKYRQALSAPVLIPSRLQKKLTTIFLAQTGQYDPYRERKRSMNRRAADFLNSEAMGALLNTCPGLPTACSTIRDMRFELDVLEISRLLCLSVWPAIWRDEHFTPTYKEIEQKLAECPSFDALRRALDQGRPKSLKILYLPDEAGGLIFDILAVWALVRMGHRVILALKDGFFFDAPTLWDVEEDPALTSALAGALIVNNSRIGKNALLQSIKENPFLVISDGTRERLNLYRTSLTFARAWKECDLVLAKGELNHRRLFLTSVPFTRDVICVHCDSDGKPLVDVKERPEGVWIFTEQEITARAEAIIALMRSEQAAGKTIMFYSAIVGSIPHETQTAMEVLNTFVAFLRAKMPGAYIINPAEHFVTGMDADDLMFMWEKVQRAGFINVWRFQTSQDIEQAFELLGRSVPPIWTGKDATFSTGCTKEMRIALDMQQSHPEMQIIGPSQDKFFRRREYGVGKFFDAAIAAR